EVVGVLETEDGNAEVYFGPVRLGSIDGVTLKLLCANRTQHSPARRGGQPPALSSQQNYEKVLPMLPV
ncbi:MAG: hypothetical protein ACLQAT_20595, partial [Candidatus Binataceae bacterium]